MQSWNAVSLNVKHSDRFLPLNLPGWASELDAKLLKRFKGAIVPSEDRLYLIKPKPEFFLSK